MRQLFKWQFLPFVFFALLITASCNDRGDVGLELLPTSDLVVVGNFLQKEGIRAYTFSDDTVRTDEPQKILLGSFNDPLFGHTQIDAALQFRLTSFPLFGTNAVADSIIFFFYYRTVYGDTSTVQRIRVFELEKAINPDATYYSTDDLSTYAANTPLAEFDFKPKVALDSLRKDTLYQLGKVKLDISLAEKLLKADSLNMVNNEVFLNYFKGLYFQPERISEEGAIVSLELIPTSAFQGSALVLYYHNDTDTLASNAYFVTDFSARVNTYRHDYSSTAFYQQLNKEITVDSLIYVQSTGGLKSKIYIPGLENWRDSLNIAINKAELVFQVDTTLSDYKNYPLPSQLFLTFIDDNGQERLPSDYSFYPVYYGGFLLSDFTYRFNITQHMQGIIKNRINNNGFYLTTVYKNNQMRRAVLKGANSDHGIRFVVTYSKLLQ